MQLGLILESLNSTAIKANNAWLPTGCPLLVESDMTIQPSILKSKRALRQPVAALYRSAKI
jgi:hypothetical protein